MKDLLKPLLGKLCKFSQDRFGFSHPPKLFLRTDSNNSQNILGKTAFYDPQKQSVTLYVDKRHPKDILRSFSHELVHHAQNLRGDLSPEKMTKTGPGYAQECPHMRKMEKEAYLQGNMCFRDFEDGLKNKLYTITIAESKYLNSKENKTMTTKITKEFLKEQIRKILSEEPVVKPGVFKQKITNPPGETIDNAKNDELALGRELAAARKRRRDTGGGVQVELGDKPGPTAAQTGGRNTSTAKVVPEGDCNKPKAGKRRDKELEEVEEFEGEVVEEEVEDIDEGKAHGKCKNGCQCEPIQENEELEEKKAKPDYIDIDGDGNKKESMKKAAADLKKKKKKKKKKANESKIQTPEQENTLYEQRFTPKNNRLFEKLLKEWAK